MSKIRITSEKIKELFQKYDDLNVNESPIDCGKKVRKFLTNLLDTGSVPKTWMQKTSHQRDILNQKIDNAEESLRIYRGDEIDPLATSKKKNDELALRFAITNSKELLIKLREIIDRDNKTLRYALLASILSTVAGIGSTYALYLAYPLNIWIIGQYTWQIGLVVSLIAAFYIWKVVRYNSSPTQIIIAIILTPIFAIITTFAIVLASSAMNYYILKFAGDPNSYLFLGPQTSIHLARNN